MSVLSDQNFETNVREDLTRYEIFNLLIKKNENIGIELGVANGDFSKKALQTGLFKFFFGVDSYSDTEKNLFGPDAHNEDQYKLALKNIGLRENYNLLRMDFDNALELFRDNYFDFIYIDGFASTGQSGGKLLVDWYKKLKIGGIFAGDDYHEDFLLNKKVINDFSKKINTKLSITGILNEKNNYAKYPSWFLIKENNIDVKINVKYVNLAKLEEKKLFKFRRSKISIFKRKIKSKLVLFLKKIFLYKILKKIYHSLK